MVNFGYDDAFVKTNSAANFSHRNLQLIPAKPGLKYFVFSDLIYIQVTVGATILGNHSDADADKTAGFTYSPAAGVLLKLAPNNYVDAGFYFQQTQSFWNNGGGNVSSLGLRLAYSFGLNGRQPQKAWVLPGADGSDAALSVWDRARHKFSDLKLYLGRDCIGKRYSDGTLPATGPTQVHFGKDCCEKPLPDRPVKRSCDAGRKDVAQITSCNA